LAQGLGDWLGSERWGGQETGRASSLVLRRAEYACTAAQSDCQRVLGVSFFNLFVCEYYRKKCFWFLMTSLPRTIINLIIKRVGFWGLGVLGFWGFGEEQELVFDRGQK